MGQPLTEYSEVDRCHALSAIADRLYSPLREANWPVGTSVEERPWRVGPPAAFCTDWHGEAELSVEQVAWFSERDAYARVQELKPVNAAEGELSAGRCLVVFDQRVISAPAVLFHATPTANVDAILSRGLLPGRWSGVFTTKFPESELRVHFFDTAAHCTTEWLHVAANRGRVPTGEYTVLRIESVGVRGLLLDPCTVCGYITEEPVEPSYITVSDHPLIAVGDP